MNATLSHRGPDDAGAWISVDNGVGLAHRRLSILDLSRLGRNPMRLGERRLWITYNGEVYNFLELRRELEGLGYKFRSNTDTEVVLAAYDHWGLGCLQRFNGMFAFGLWDGDERRLFLARDRLGEKPLYYAEYGRKFAFASELKALLADPEFPREIDSDAVALYLRYGYVPAPYSIFRHARKLPAAHYAIYQEGHLRIDRYWDPVAIALARQTKLDEAEATEMLEGLLKDSVRRRMISDVPVGAFLSGGIDSSLVVALMKEQRAKALKTFTIRFDNPLFNEADYAAAVAKNLGTEHHEETCGVAQMITIIERLPDYFDEPFADPSAIPTHLLSRFTRQHVTVSLSGDGGDELFFGYPRYHDHAAYAKRVWSPGLPRPLKQIIRAGARLVPHPRSRNLFDKLLRDEFDSYARWTTWWGLPKIEALTGRRPVPENPVYSEIRSRSKGLSFKEYPPLVDLATYLPEQILTKVDRASMAASLESRAPFLDHRVVEFSLGLPLAMKWRGGQSKRIVRHILYKRVPPALLERPKAGFDPPLADWFRGPLREKVASDLNGPWLEDLGIRPGPVRLLWSEFLAGSSVKVDLIWSVFALILWVKRWK